MPRTRIVSWIYECDALGHNDLPVGDVPHASLQVDKGAHLATGRGTVIREQADADDWIRRQGWTISARRVLCPACVEARR
jgi:hypothetical protein